MAIESDLGLYGSIACNLRVHEQRQESAQQKMVAASKDVEHERKQVLNCKAILADLDEQWFVKFVQTPCWLFRVY